MYTWNCKGRLVAWDTPRVMGILNVTPDSFYAGSRHQVENQWLETAGRFIREGAFILDIGGQSTRPGSEKVSVEEESRRVIPAIQAIHHHFPDLLISVDTFYAAVAKKAVEAGASLVNDVSGGHLDPEMIPTVARARVPFVLMHLPGDPQQMQKHTGYQDLLAEILSYFSQQIQVLQKAGVQDIILDPGIGFGKTPEQNFQLIRQLAAFHAFGYPVLLGVSRKSTVYKTLGVSPEEALNGTTVLHTAGLLNGADLLRVHDVREACEAITLVGHLKEKPAG